MKISKREVVGLVTIVLVCWLFYAFAFENNWKTSLNRWVGHLVNLSWYLIVMIIGFLSYKASKRRFWLFIYVSGLFFLAFGAILDLIIGKRYYVVAEVFGNLKAIFTSPIIYLFILFLPFRVKHHIEIQ